MSTEIAEDWLRLSDGVRLRLRCVTPAGPARASLILQHGAAADGSIYLSIAKAYAQHGIKTLLVDLRGHGDSDGRPGEVALANQYARDFAECVGMLRRQCEGVVLLGGHSSGGNIMLKSLRYLSSDAFDGLLLIAPTLAGDHRFSKEQGRSMPHFLRASFGLRYFLDFEVRPRSRARGNIKFSLRKYLLAILGLSRHGHKVLWFRGLIAKEPFGYTARAATALMLFDYQVTLSRLCKPVLLVLADRDEFVESRAIALVFRWGLSPSTPFDLTLAARGGHFAALAMSAAPVVDWCARRFPQSDAQTAPLKEAHLGAV